MSIVAIAPAQDTELTFMTGVAASGAIAPTTFWTWNSDKPATYADQSGAAKWGAPVAGTGAGTLTYEFDAGSHWTPTEQQAMVATLSLWADVANVSFQPAAAGTAGQIDFVRGDAKTGDEAGIDNATQVSIGGFTIGQALSATVTIATGVTGFGPLGSSLSDYGGYPWESLLHEEAHALGLGHTGPYDGTVNSATQQFGPYDSRAWSIMSYIEPNDYNAAYFNSSPVTNTDWGVSLGDNGKTYGNEPTTLMPLDILAIQRLYGLPTSTPLSGGQTFGFHCNVAGPSKMFFDFTVNTSPVVTLWDMGGGNTLDLSGFSQAANVNLNPGTFSSCAGLSNNLAIAYGTVIDTVIGGSGNDYLVANNDGDTLTGGPGSDFLLGGTGLDTFKDTQANLATDIIAGLHLGDRLDFTDANPASFTFSLNGAVLSYGGFSLNFSAAPIGNFVQQADPNGGVDLVLASANVAPTAHANLLQDFNGDGDSDLLWRNQSGVVTTWQITASGGAYQEVQNVYQNSTVSNDWRLQGSVDLNGDGQSDLLWRNTANGTFTVWDSTGASFTPNSYVDSSVAPSWTLSGFGDYNGDGRSDLLWRNASGAYAEWTSTGTGYVQNVTTGFVDPSWQVVGEGDFNGDGKTDLLWRNTDGRYATWDSTGSGFTQNVADGFVGQDWHVAGVGDFNGDGKADILWRNNDGTITEWQSTGTGFIQNVFIGAVDPSWKVAQIGDFNGDGKADIVWRHDNGDLTIWQSTGTGFAENVVINFVTPDWTLVAHPYEVI